MPNNRFLLGNSFSLSTGGYIYERVIPQEEPGADFDEIIPTIVISNLLVANGHGIFAALGEAWGIFISEQPEIPDNCITVYDNTGANLGKGTNSEAYIRPGIQIRVRSKTYSEGTAKLSRMNAFFDTVFRSPIYKDEAIIGYLQNVSRLQDYLPLGRDQLRRYMFSCNYVLTLVRE